jgi:hypothetical protein
MNQKFVFTGREKMATFIMMGIGVLSILIGLTISKYGGEHADVFTNHRLWSNLLNNATFFLGVSLLAFFLMCGFVTGYSGWFIAFKRVMEAITMFIPVGGIIMIIIVVAGVMGLHDIYFWTDPHLIDPADSHYDQLIHKKSGFLNARALIGASIFFVLVWTFFSRKLRSISVAEDNDATAGTVWYLRSKVWAASFLPLGAFTSAFAIWYWLMSIEPHWYSTMFAWYATASMMVSAIAVIILFLQYLQSKGYYKEVLITHYHDLGKFLFGFSIFWTYLWFSQYMLIWYANIGEETIHFQNQLKHFPALFYALLILNFAMPLLILMRNSNKWKSGSLIFMCIVILLGHWLDFYMMSKSGLYIELHHHLGAHDMNFMMGYNFPGLIEVGTMVGFLGLFVFVVFSSLAKANLIPTNDPLLGETLTHQGGPLGPEIHHH